MYDASPIVNAGSRKWKTIRNANWIRDSRTGSSVTSHASCRGAPLRAHELLGKPAIRCESPPGNLASRGSRGERAVGLAHVPAVPEAALAQPRAEFHEGGS